MEKENFVKLMVDFKTLLNIWKQRWLSLAGKIQVYKSLTASEPVYIATMRIVLDTIIDTLQGLHKEFMLNGQQPKIKHGTLISEYSHGGLCDTDMKSKLLSSNTLWIRQLKDKANFHPWRTLANEFLKPLGRDTVSYTTFQPSSKFAPNIKKIPTFYRELIENWKQSPSGQNDDIEFILS